MERPSVALPLLGILSRRQEEGQEPSGKALEGARPCCRLLAQGTGGDTGECSRTHGGRGMRQRAVPEQQCGPAGIPRFPQPEGIFTPHRGGERGASGGSPEAGEWGAFCLHPLRGRCA